MKLFFALLLLTLTLSSCENGDLNQVTFEFNDTPATACNVNVTDAFFIYKIQDRRALIVQLQESNFENEITADKLIQPIPLEINAANIRLIYREYSDDVTKNTICSTIPAANPTVVQEREATAGTITVTTTAIKSAPNANGARSITAYLHTLVFRDLVFDLGDGNTQINEAFTQVTYQTTATAFTSFAGPSPLFSCTNAPIVLFKFLNKQALVLNLSAADAAELFSNSPGPKSILLSDENSLKRLFFNTAVSTLTESYFCTNPAPVNPSITDAFTAENGVVGQSGIIEVTTLSSINGFKHTIVFKNMIFAKGSLKVEMGNEFIFGEFETNN
jgi:hypothetical protein